MRWWHEKVPETPSSEGSASTVVVYGSNKLVRVCSRKFQHIDCMEPLDASMWAWTQNFRRMVVIKRVLLLEFWAERYSTLAHICWRDIGTLLPQQLIFQTSNVQREEWQRYRPTEVGYKILTWWNLQYRTSKAASFIVAERLLEIVQFLRDHL